MAPSESDILPDGRASHSEGGPPVPPPMPPGFDPAGVPPGEGKSPDSPGGTRHAPGTSGPSPLPTVATSEWRTPSPAPPSGKWANPAVPETSKEAPSPPEGKKPAEPASTKVVEVTARNAPPWLVSSLVHMIVIILLGLSIVADRPKRQIQLEAILDRQGEQLEHDTLSELTDAPRSDELVITQPSLMESSDPFAAMPAPDVSLHSELSSSNLDAPQIGNALKGRGEGGKQRLLAAYGGNGQSEAAVLAGLKWLAKQQRPDGSWSLLGPYPDPGGFENVAAATAMALIAFQGAGHTHQKGTFKDNVAKGSRFLLSLQNAEGNFYHDGHQNDWFYTQGQATIAICELYAMTEDSALRLPAEKAVEFCVGAQDQLGGWRYKPRFGSDLSVTGWVLMGLQSARMAGLKVPQETLYRVSEFLDQLEYKGGSRYSYQIRMPATESMTAEGLLCRQYLGWSPKDERLTAGADYLLEQDHLPDWTRRDIYYWYYATQMLHHLGGERWKKWNGVMRDLLVKHQESSGRSAGSWHPLTPEPDRWGYHGGRLYVTCLSLYVLEVYYRHLPLYDREVPFEE